MPFSLILMNTVSDMSYTSYTLDSTKTIQRTMLGSSNKLISTSNNTISLINKPTSMTYDTILSTTFTLYKTIISNKTGYRIESQRNSNYALDFSGNLMLSNIHSSESSYNHCLWFDISGGLYVLDRISYDLSRNWKKDNSSLSGTYLNMNNSVTLSNTSQINTYSSINFEKSSSWTEHTYT